MIVTLESSVGDIVADDFRAAAVFHRHGIDFCCGGRRTLDEACRARDLNPREVLNELERACARPDQGAPRAADWSPETLIAYIVGKHHAYVRSAIPTIGALLGKVAASHGRHHPELDAIAVLFDAVSAELTSHLVKEEKILFPYISEVADAVSRGLAPPPAPFGAIDNPIRMMEHVHDTAGDLLAQIRTLSRGFAVPEDACATYRVCFQELEAFERDLHEHVHLENNVLFPKARALAQSKALDGLPCERIPTVAPPVGFTPFGGSARSRGPARQP